MNAIKNKISNIETDRYTWWTVAWVVILALNVFAFVGSILNPSVAGILLGIAGVSISVFMLVQTRFWARQKRRNDALLEDVDILLLKTENALEAGDWDEVEILTSDIESLLGSYDRRFWLWEKR